jgi:hypothetical protein
MGPAWTEDQDSPQLRANLDAIAVEIFKHAQAKLRPDKDLPRRWHKRMCEGLDVPSAAYRGRYRGEAHPDLRDYHVVVDCLPGVEPRKVGGEVTRLMTWLRGELPTLDKAHSRLERSTRDQPRKRSEVDERVLSVAARLHGEWIRIHPFVNGNGRTARMWVLWLSSRYGLPPLLPLRPRPSPPYGDVSRASLAAADHTGMETLLRQCFQLHAAVRPSGS